MEKYPNSQPEQDIDDEDLDIEDDDEIYSSEERNKIMNLREMEDRKIEDTIAIIKDLKDPGSKNLAVYILGEGDYSSEGYSGPAGISREDANKLIGYISDHEKNHDQEDIINYIYSRIKEEEDLLIDAHDPDIDSTLYGYEVGVDMTEEIESINNGKTLTLESNDGQEFHFKIPFGYNAELDKGNNLATMRVTAKRVSEDNLYFMERADYTKNEKLRYLELTHNRFYGDVNLGILETAKITIGDGKKYISENTHIHKDGSPNGMEGNEYIKIARKLEDNINFVSSCYSSYVQSIARGNERIADTNE